MTLPFNSPSFYFSNWRTFHHWKRHPYERIISGSIIKIKTALNCKLPSRPAAETMSSKDVRGVTTPLLDSSYPFIQRVFISLPSLLFTLLSSLGKKKGACTRRQCSQTVDVFASHYWPVWIPTQLNSACPCVPTSVVWFHAVGCWAKIKKYVSFYFVCKKGGKQMTNSK